MWVYGTYALTSEVTAPAPGPPGGREEPPDWLLVFIDAPVHHLGHFLDRKDFAALQTTSARLQIKIM